MAGSRLRAVALAGVTALALLGTSTAPAPAAHPPRRRPRRADHYQGWSGPADWRTGTRALGTAGHPARARPAAWPSPWLRPQAGTTDVHRPAHRHHPHLGVRHLDLAGDPRSASTPASWSPPGTPRPRPAPGSRSRCRAPTTPATRPPWYVMGRWASGDARHQADHASTGRVTLVDHLDRHVLHRRRRRRGAAAGYQLRLTLYRAPGQTASPRVWMLGAMALERAGPVHRAARAPGTSPGAGNCRCRATRRTSTPGQYPEYDGGGEAWCSPDLDRDGRRVLGRASRRRPTPPGSTRPTPTRRSTTPPG